MKRRRWAIWIGILTFNSLTYATNIGNYSPDATALKQFSELTKAANYMYDQDPAKAKKLLEASTAAKKQFSDNPQLYFVFGQLEIFISNLLAYKQTPGYTSTELAVHNNKLICRISIDQKVYDISKFLKKYPTFSTLESRCGKDQSSFFNSKSIEAKTLKDSLAKYIIGNLK